MGAASGGRRFEDCAEDGLNTGLAPAIHAFSSSQISSHGGERDSLLVSTKSLDVSSPLATLERERDLGRRGDLFGKKFGTKLRLISAPMSTITPAI